MAVCRPDIWVDAGQCEALCAALCRNTAHIVRAGQHPLIVQAEEAAEYVNFLSSLPHLTSVVKENRRPLLPPQQPNTNKKTLVLDLDHTLIRSTQHSFTKAKV